MIPVAVIVATVAVLALVIVVAVMGGKLSKRSAALATAEASLLTTRRELLQSRADHAHDIDRLETVIRQQDAELAQADAAILEGESGSARDALGRLFSGTDPTPEDGEPE